MRHRIEDILDECLGLIAQGQTVEECLSRYPEQAAELEPLLRTAAVMRQQALASPIPSPVARAAGRQVLLTALADRQERRRRFFPLRGWSVAMASLVVALFLGTGTVLASFQAVPEETLYPVKRTVERVQLALSPSPESHARTLVRHSDNRLKEIEALEKKGKVAVAEKLRERLKAQLQKAADLVITVEQRGGDGRVVVAAMERNLAQYRARLAAEKAKTAAAMSRREGAAPQEEALREEAPVSSAAPAPRPAAAQAPAAAERQPKALPPRAIRALEKALNDYEAALERLKARIEQHHQQKTPRPPQRQRR
ncbi:MAG: DUF5667 domain-containing protein [Dehalococcoidia bacterium]